MSNTDNAGIWTTKDGRKIPIREMSDQHLLNTIRMLRRNGCVTADEFACCAAAAYTFSSDSMAAMAAEQELSRTYLLPKLEELLEEMGRRNLTEEISLTLGPKREKA